MIDADQEVRDRAGRVLPRYVALIGPLRPRALTWGSSTGQVNPQTNGEWIGMLSVCLRIRRARRRRGYPVRLPRVLWVVIDDNEVAVTDLFPVGRQDLPRVIARCPFTEAIVSPIRGRGWAFDLTLGGGPTLPLESAAGDSDTAQAMVAALHGPDTGR